MKVVVNIYENQVSLVKPGMHAYINLDALPDQRFAGQVTSVASMPEPSRDGNPNYRVYKAEVLVMDKLPEIKPGITARVDVLIAELQDAIKVPLQAVVGAGDRQFCFVEKDGDLTPVPVEVGLFDNDFVQITAGLEVGDLITLAPPLTAELPAEKDDEKPADKAKPAPTKDILADTRKPTHPS
jgi:HlyD family secretion protein